MDDGFIVQKGVLGTHRTRVSAADVATAKIVQSDAGKGMGFCVLVLTLSDGSVVESPPLANPERVRETLRSFVE